MFARTTRMTWSSGLSECQPKGPYRLPELSGGAATPAISVQASAPPSA